MFEVSRKKMSELSEEELIKQLLNSPRGSETRSDLFEELWRRYQGEVGRSLEKLIGCAPESYAREYFLEEGRQLTAKKLLLSIDTYRRTGPFKHWLGIVIRSVVVDLRRKESSRSEKERPPCDFKKSVEEEARTETDEETLSRLALKFESNYYVEPGSWYGDPARWLEIEEKKYVIQSALTIHALTDYKSAKAIKKRFWEGLDETEMCDYFGKPMRTLYRWLHNNLIKLRMILALDFGITSISQIL